MLFLGATRTAAQSNFPDNFDPMWAPLCAGSRMPGPRDQSSCAAHLQPQFSLGDLAAGELSHDAAFEHDQDAV